ncbi:DUF5941 domain-containing protein [Actinomadura sp. WMMB 499]|uniref:DUF5941 domain-containing protein n=1 Tax=Actinomadura sp. WMMB 499 TaxID=1219491 RepID=UPI0020C7ECC7|nr:DUF5941 domain-containing protein [Actinomadura sp. WMMB 499]
MTPDAAALRVHRDDGPLARALGVLARGGLPPVPGAAGAAASTGILLAAGDHGYPVPALFAPVIAVLLVGPAAAHPHTGRLDWTAPPMIRGIEYGYLTVLGFAHAVAAPLVFALVALLALHHHDTVHRTRRGPRRQRLLLAGLGWEGRMLIVACGGLSGSLPFAYAALAAYLGVLFGGEGVAAWARAGLGERVQVDLEEEEA